MFDVSTELMGGASILVACNVRRAEERLVVRNDPFKEYLGNSLISQMRSADIAFVVDCTGSMDEYVAAVRESVELIVQSLDKSLKLVPEWIRFAWVPYADYYYTLPEKVRKNPFKVDWDTAKSKYEFYDPQEDPAGAYAMLDFTNNRRTFSERVRN